VKVDWLLLAEGVGQDSKGALTAIGLSQNVLAAPSLPATTKRAVIAHLVEEAGGLKLGDKISVKVRVTSPAGEVISAQNAQAIVGGIQWPDLPMSVDLPVEILLNVSEYGAYRFEVFVQPVGADEMKGEVGFYVVEGPGTEVAAS